MKNFFRKGKRGLKPLRKATKKTYKKKSVASKVSRLSRQMRSLVKKEEVKKLQYNLNDVLTSYSVGNMGAVNTMYKIPLSFTAIGTQLPCPLGTNSASRIGNKVEMVHGHIRFKFYPLAYNAISNTFPQPVILKIWLVLDKENPRQEPSSDLPYFFDSGANASPPVGNLKDTFSVVNSQRYKVLKTYTRKIGFSSINGTGASAANEFYQNNDFKLSHDVNINYSKYLIKNCKFNDEYATGIPTTRGLWLMMEVVSALNYDLLAGQKPVGFYCQQELRWKDT